jgi:hypothetical protein
MRAPSGKITRRRELLNPTGSGLLRGRQPGATRQVLCAPGLGEYIFLLISRQREMGDDYAIRATPNLEGLAT